MNGKIDDKWDIDEKIRRHLAEEQWKDDIGRAIINLTMALVKNEATPASSQAHVDSARAILNDMETEDSNHC